VKLVSRLRLDATLHHLPGPQPKGTRGPKLKKGARQSSLADRLADPKARHLVVLIAKILHPKTLPIRQASWYPKQEAAFSDMLATVPAICGIARISAHHLETPTCS
jgi:hypothetical protein